MKGKGIVNIQLVRGQLVTLFTYFKYKFPSNMTQDRLDVSLERDKHCKSDGNNVT